MTTQALIPFNTRKNFDALLSNGGTDEGVLVTH